MQLTTRSWRSLVTTILCVAASAAPGAALALMPPEVYEAAREEATAVVVMRVEAVDIPGQTPGGCVARGVVETLERDASGALAEGAPLSFAVACALEDDEVPDGGVIWTPIERLERASMMRAWLDRAEDGSWQVVRSQTEILALDREPAQRFPWVLAVMLGIAIMFATGAIVWARSRAANA